MFLGYNTNGLPHNALFDAVELLAEIGYRGVAITIDHHALPPGSADTPRDLARLRRLLESRGMRSAIETGARFLLDPRVKHAPTLLSEDCRRRIDFYKYAVDCAADLGSDCVSLWSGRETGPFFGQPGLSAERPHAENMDLSPLHAEQWSRVVAGLAEVLEYAARQDVRIGFEPEPGMFIDTMEAFESLLAAIDATNLRLTLDIGHLHCQGETPIAEVIRRWGSRLVNVHIEDMRAGVHEHLMFGEGEIEFPPVLRALAEVGYTGGVYVELPRHAHEGPAAARRAISFLSELMQRNDEV